jgi:nitrogen regulatory protein PII
MDKNLDAIISVVNRGQGKTVSETLNDVGILRNLVLLGEGTAERHWADIFGMGPEKDIVVSISQHKNTPTALQKLSDELNLTKPNGGIAFSVPLSGVGGIKTFTILAGLSEIPEVGDLTDECNEDYMDCQHEVIWTIVNQGHSDEVVEAAKKSGARGATVLSARGTGTAETEKFFGLTIQPEKDIVMILVPSEIRRDVMTEICKNTGLSSEGKGISFSLPVSEVAGINNE